MASPAALDVTNHGSLKLYSTNLLLSIKGLKLTKLYYYFLLGHLYSRFRPEVKYGKSHLWFEVFEVHPPTARQTIAVYNILRAYPVILSCSFDYSHITRFKNKLIERINSDQELRHLLSSTSSKAAKIIFPKDINIPEFKPEADEMDPSDMLTDGEEEPELENDPQTDPTSKSSSGAIPRVIYPKANFNLTQLSITDD